MIAALPLSQVHHHSRGTLSRPTSYPRVLTEGQFQ